MFNNFNNQQTAGSQQQAESGEAAAGQPSISPPAITIPKGGGAIRGIDEKFSVNPATGTGSMSIPIFTSPGRQGFGPQLSLSYDSGAGNGPFGLGWNLSLPNISRKTDKGVPQYLDAEGSDTFILTGAEDLVPTLVESDGDWDPVIFDHPDEPYTIQRFRPRIEGLFARIERWTHLDDGDVHWRSISRDNILTLYGKDNNSRITGPDNPDHIFSWLICETRDDKGNAVIYEYKAEDGAGVDLTKTHERNRGERGSPLRQTRRYIKRIKYGNRDTLLDDTRRRPVFVDPGTLDDVVWLFEVLFDYGEGHSTAEPATAEGREFVAVLNQLPSTAEWPVRQDPFSTYRAGFEVRTYRLCRSVLIFHHFPDELDGVGDYLVRSTEFTHDEGPVASYLTSVIQSGYIHDSASRFLRKSLPPVEFEYSQVPLQDGLQLDDMVDLDISD
ncbi:MAG: SpvB/TcaC N-terminal domain-containing protein, partial [Planctomycetota bacterium]